MQLIGVNVVENKQIYIYIYRYIYHVNANFTACWPRLVWLMLLQSGLSQIAKLRLRECNRWYLDRCIHHHHPPVSVCVYRRYNGRVTGFGCRDTVSDMCIVKQAGDLMRYEKRRHLVTVRSLCSDASPPLHPSQPPVTTTDIFYSKFSCSSTISRQHNFSPLVHCPASTAPKPTPETSTLHKPPLFTSLLLLRQLLLLYWFCYPLLHPGRFVSIILFILERRALICLCASANCLYIYRI